jgi:hypothetical protein
LNDKNVILEQPPPYDYIRKAGRSRKGSGYSFSRVSWALGAWAKVAFRTALGPSSNP